jgi:hypothetical protein
MSSIDPKRAKTARGRRALQKMAPKLDENPRTTLVVRGQKTSAVINSALTDLFMLKKPNAKHFTRHNAVHPFEDAAPLEFLCQKNDASLFAFGTHSKKRPHNLVLGRLFDHHILDMFELGVEGFQSMAEFAAEVGGGTPADAKPVLLFSGAEWEHDSQLAYLRTLLVDFFHQQVVEKVSPLGIEQVLSFTAMPGRKVFVRTCARHSLTDALRANAAKPPSWRSDAAEHGGAAAAPHERGAVGCDLGRSAALALRAPPTSRDVARRQHAARTAHFDALVHDGAQTSPACSRALRGRARTCS